MRSVNKVFILGNLTRDPELRYTPAGQPVASFGIATNRRFKNAAGELQEQAEFHNVVAWGKLAEICQQLLYKGRGVWVEGRLQTRSWEGQDGVRRQRTEVIAENLSALGPAKGGRVEEGLEVTAEAKATPPPEPDIEEIFEGEEKPKKKSPKKAEKSEKEEKKEEIDLDEIPF